MNIDPKTPFSPVTGNIRTPSSGLCQDKQAHESLPPLLLPSKLGASYNRRLPTSQACWLFLMLMRVFSSYTPRQPFEQKLRMAGLHLVHHSSFLGHSLSSVHCSHPCRAFAFFRPPQAASPSPLKDSGGFPSRRDALVVGTTSKSPRQLEGGGIHDFETVAFRFPPGERDQVHYTLT